jgi:WD40 repeat protein
MIELTGHRGRVVALAYSPDGQTLASASTDGTARLWDLTTGKLTATLQSPAARAYCVAFSPDGNTLAVGYGEPHGLVELWDLHPPRRMEIWAAHPRTTRSIAFQPRGALLATAGDEALVSLWIVVPGMPTVRAQQQFSLDHVPGAAVRFSTDGQWLGAVTNRPATMRVWRNNGELLRSSKRISDWGYCLAFRGDGLRVAAGLEGTVAVQDPLDYRPPYIWPAHDGPVLGVAFTPDGQTLLTGGADGLVKLWDSSGRLLQTFDWKIRDVGAVAFAPDGLTAAAGGVETILVWDVDA